MFIKTCVLLVFTGGCLESIRPPDVLVCNPPCAIRHSYCNDTDYCVCERLYEPVLDRLNALIDCVMENSTDLPVSPKTVTLPGKFLSKLKIATCNANIAEVYCIHLHTDREHSSGSVVECLTREGGAAGLNLTRVTVLCP